MRKQTWRALALALCVALALGLAAPALAATPAMTGSEAVAETPAITGLDTASSHSHSPAVADEPADLSAACCSPATPHAANATIEYPTGGTDHYCVASTGSYVNINLQLVGDAVGSSVAKSNLSNISNSNGLYQYKHKVPDGGTATVTLKKNGVETVITLHMVDPNAHVHTFGSGTVVRQATCGADGERHYTCTAAGCSNPPYVKTEVIPATGNHTWSDTYETITEPTCTTKGLEGKACANCDAVNTNDTREMDMLPHTYKNGVSGICLVCQRDSVTGEVHTHTWDKPAGADADGWVVDDAATCQVTGTKHRTCSNADCGRVEHATIPKAAHDFSSGTCPMCGKTQTEVAGNMADQGGALESAWVEWPIQSGVYRYEVYVKEVSAANYPSTPIDSQLIRRYPGNLMRADALGLKGSASGIDYKMKVVAYDESGNELPAMQLESGPLTVYAHIREGYAFWDKSLLKTGSGAYNEDGTLKSNAVVVYVDNSNFNTVEVTAGGHSFKGVQMMVSDGDSFSKLLPGTPLCIRILGTIDAQTGFPSSAWGSTSEGLQIKGKDPYTNKNLTIEGVGKDGAVHGFGMLLRNCGNVEIRNLGFFNVNDDGVSIDTDNCNLWIHNNDFFYGKNGGGDKAKGDGALDTKLSKQITHSFNHFWDNGKCNLQGMKDETTDNTITYHHNWFDHSDSRHPRVRTGTIHVYNNYYDGNAKYGVGVTSGGSVFVENNYFRNVTRPMMISLQGTDAKGEGTFSGEEGGVIKSYNNTMVMEGRTLAYIPYTSGTDFDAYEAKTRSETVPSTVKTASGGHTYNNFDTAADFYSYNVQSPEDAKNTVVQWAGRVQGGDFKWTFDNATQDANYAIIPALGEAILNYKGTLVSVGGVVEGGITSGPISVSKVSLNMTSLSLKPGDTSQLIASVIPSTATDKAVSWKSSAPAVATVSDDGQVTAVANGSATITVTTDDGGKTATCAVTVSGGGSNPGPGPGDETTKTYILKGDEVFSKLTPNGQDSSQHDIYTVPTSGETLAKQGTDGLFTIYAGNGSKIDYSKKDFGTYRINLGGKATVGDTPSNVIGFTTDAAATVTVKWYQAGGNNGATDQRNLVIYDSAGSIAAQTTNASSMTYNTAQTTQLKLTKGGTYYLGGLENKNWIFSVEVAVEKSDAEKPFMGEGDAKVHYEVSSTGAVTMLDLPTAHTVFATYWKGNVFLGARPIKTSNAAAAAFPGYTSIRLIWVNDKAVPQSAAKDI